MTKLEKSSVLEWAYQQGVEAAEAKYRPIVEELVKALEFYTKESNFEKTVWEDDDMSGPCEPYDFEDGELLERHPDGVLSDFGLLAEAALESVRSKI